MNELHYKGLLFDSLTYRFKDYQARVFDIEVKEYKHKYNVSELDARRVVRDRHIRDFMRFKELLDEAIGEHD